MKKVQPIRSLKQLSAMKNILRGQEKYRDLLLLELGINSALRITDLLSLQVHYLYNENLQPKEEFAIQERKTKKSNTIIITPKVKNTLKLYAEQHKTLITDPDNYVFYSKCSE